MVTEADQLSLFYRFGAALLIGLLVGLQREYAHLQQAKEEKTFGGVRTFALLGLLGCTAAFLAEQLQSLLAFVAIVTVVGGLIMIAYVTTAHPAGVPCTSGRSRRLKTDAWI